MEATLLLCDYAEEVGGKLYIMGGGWTQATANAPLQISLALNLLIPWDQTNVTHRLDARLVTQDGEEVTIDGNPVLIEGQVEVGRPAGTKPGMAMATPLAFRVGGLVLEPGLYRWDVRVNEQVVATASFEAVGR